MKFKTFIVFALVASSSAFASQIECGRRGANAYLFSVRTAAPGMETVGTLKIPGERGLQKLSCAIPAIEPRRPGPFGGDRTYPIMLCGNGRGYGVKVEGGGRLGPSAKVTFQGRHSRNEDLLAVLSCSSR